MVFARIGFTLGSAVHHCSSILHLHDIDVCNVKEGSVPLCRVPHFYICHLACPFSITFQPSLKDSWEVKLGPLSWKAGRSNLALGVRSTIVHPSNDI